MRVHRTIVTVSDDHEVRLTLPNDFPQGEAEVIVVVAAPEPQARKLTADEFLASRRPPPLGVGPVSLQAIEEAIAQGACDRDRV